MNFNWFSDDSEAKELNTVSEPAGDTVKPSAKGGQPVKSPQEVKWSLRYGYDLSDVPEPLYQIACYLQKVCSFFQSQNKRDLIQVQPACDLFYDEDYVNEESKETYGKQYDPDVEANVTSFAAFEFSRRTAS